MRLVDRLRAGLVEQSPRTVLPGHHTDSPGRPDSDSYSAYIARIRKDIDHAQIIVIDNVAEFALGEGSKEKWDVADVPNAAPPWGLAWYEYRLPAQYRRVHQLEAIGLWAAVRDRDEGGWELHIWPFALPVHARQIVGPISVLIADVRADGTVEALRPGSLEGFDTPEEAYTPLILTVPLLLANSFAHCKNVSEQVITPPSKLSDRNKHRHGLPLVRYTVLSIDPMREVLRREGKSAETGAKKALHICRGHFKTYDRKPLFNRLTGTYWFPEHVRGRASAGTVKKDYVVSAPAGDGAVEARAVTTQRNRPRHASPEHIAEVEAFSVARALELVAVRYPGMSVEAQAHSNPGYDIRVRSGEEVARYVEVKGTTTDSPGFMISENERRFSVDNADRYSLVLIGEINLASGGFVPYWHDGAIDDRFALRPTQYTAAFPTAGEERNS